MRYYCKQKEQRRQRIYEKALDTAATSPFARAVKSWVLAGEGKGGEGRVCNYVWWGWAEIGEGGPAFSN